MSRGNACELHTNLELLFVDLPLGVDPNLPEPDLGELRQREGSGQDAVVQLLRLPLPDDVAVRVDDELEIVGNFVH